MRYFLKISFDGTHYHGWQVQENANSVQAECMRALSLLLKCETRCTGAGRTDTGVHAKEFYVHFDHDKEIFKADFDNLRFRLNALLPFDIAVQSLIQVNKEAHARFSAISRTYQYLVSLEKDPFLLGKAWFLKVLPDIGVMNRGAEMLLQFEDFSSFSKLHSGSKTSFCKVSHASWEKNGHVLVFSITANRFLRNMVRAVVGSLIDLGMGKNDLEGFRKIIESGKRSEAGQSAPPQGLYLTKVEYPNDFFL